MSDNDLIHCHLSSINHLSIQPFSNIFWKAHSELPTLITPVMLFSITTKGKFINYSLFLHLIFSPIKLLKFGNTIKAIMKLGSAQKCKGFQKIFLCHHDITHYNKYVHLMLLVLVSL